MMRKTIAAGFALAAFAFAGGDDECSDGHGSWRSTAARLVRQGLLPYLARTHDRIEAHQDRPDRGRIASHTGADDGRHRPAVPPRGQKVWRERAREVLVLSTIS